MKTNWRRELPSLLLLGVMLVLLAATWPVAPERVPVHWNAAGEIDGYGSKTLGLLLPPLFGLGLYLVLLLAPRVDPGRANYATFSDTYLVIRTSVLALITIIYGVTCLAARGVEASMEVVAPLAVGALFVVLGSVMGKIRPNWFVGIRTPWTISSKTSWVRTHRLGGWLFLALGLAFVVGGLTRQKWVGEWIVVGALAMIGTLFVYSYFAWRGDPHKVPPAGTLPGNDG
jgi:uncharacterized membrane protein